MRDPFIILIVISSLPIEPVSDPDRDTQAEDLCENVLA